MQARGASPWVQVGALTAITILVLFARRPDQFLHPYIWVEEGQYVLREYLDGGLWILTKPLAGYHQLASKIIAYVAFKTSILWAPEIALALVVVFTCAVVIAVALSPTHLRWPFLCAISVLLIPTDAEVFAVSAYAFWWAGVLLLLVVLWDPDRDREWLRWLYIVLGGLSSPLIVTVAGLLALRAVVERRRSEYLAFAIAAFVAFVQFLTLRAQHVDLSMSTLGLETLKIILQQYVGGFLYGHANAYFGFAAFALLIMVGWFIRSQLDRYFFLLLLTFLLICASVSLRMPIESFGGIDQFDAGPRYFFYPFILLSWIMIWMASLSATPVRIGFAAAFLVALLMAGSGLSRRHDAINWRENLEACASSDKYELPFHYIGHANEMWHATFTGEECRALLKQSLF
jgi:hypothetical protein